MHSIKCWLERRILLLSVNDAAFERICASCNPHACAIHVPYCWRVKSAYFMSEGWTLKSKVVGSEFAKKTIKITAKRVIIFILFCKKEKYYWFWLLKWIIKNS